ncbi:MAG: type IV pili twitching motility protein PilT, partial [Candidatus Omnitrophica bacterium]|nr:type IV pili twitching motility protein PilT [Candidatus Omnitrophota bacterium]
MTTTTTAAAMELLKQMVQRGASDLHLGVSYPPTLRIDGALVPLEYPPLNHDEMAHLLQQVLAKEQMEKFIKQREFDMAFGVEGLGRFRVNAFFQRGKMGAAIRLIPDKIRSFEECGLPADSMNYFCNRPKGLVLVTGAT